MTLDMMTDGETNYLLFVLGYSVLMCGK